ncbi:PIN domain-containing protein [Azohydromonas lata]|uniref:PIN domain-containing protein n=1 Tax=Azohydromonas lata TaxID=45677 RepID=A0ABU5IIU2_9BURK|nr:PIN domain-containing protein [Azohydromonas lata]MDZ5458600.1 PIN domain-containing protein [Azohydromonas lata]
MNTDNTLVLLDTCVLMPPRLSDVLMDLRAQRLFSLHWSGEIEAEYVRNMQAVLGFEKTAVLRRLAAMKRCCPEWQVPVAQRDMSAVPASVDAKDRHVAAAALALRRYADEEGDPEAACSVFLVTFNTADMAVRPMGTKGVKVLRPGAFLDLVYDMHPEPSALAVQQAARDLKHPPYTLAELLGALHGHGAKGLVKRLAALWGLVPVRVGSSAADARGEES